MSKFFSDPDDKQAVDLEISRGTLKTLHDYKQDYGVSCGIVLAELERREAQIKRAEKIIALAALALNSGEFDELEFCEDRGLIDEYYESAEVSWRELFWQELEKRK